MLGRALLKVIFQQSLTQLVRSGKLQAKLQEEIRFLADAHGGPVFPPHVTLIGGVSSDDEQYILNSASEIARRLTVCLAVLALLQQIVAVKMQAECC